MHALSKRDHLVILLADYPEGLSVFEGHTKLQEKGVHCEFETTRSMMTSLVKTIQVTSERKACCTCGSSQLHYRLNARGRDLYFNLKQMNKEKTNG